jgi:anaerobic ribonucleoside-triphosphate reductase activating protein
VEGLIDHVIASAHEADGLTVSGGEPFDQPDALAALLSAWRATLSASIFVFTGRELEEISGWLERHPGLIDAIMTGPFRSDLPQTLALRGSDNQKLHVLTDAGAEFVEYDREAGVQDRKLDVLFDEAGNAWFAGVPARGEFRKLRRLLESEGHHVVTSDFSASRQA